MMSFKEYQEFLTEMPKLIKSWDPIELIDPERNKDNYLDLLREKRKTKLFDLTDVATMYEWKDNFFVLDTSIEQITYDMTFKLGDEPNIGGKFVWQTGVWINPVHQYIEGVAAKMFFEVLLKRHETIITDSIQTFDGKRFWERNIGKAFVKGLNVYYYDFQTKELAKIENAIHWETFKKTHKDIWGKTDRHKMKKMVITNKTLL